MRAELETKPNPKTPDYQLKSDLIAQLKSCGSNSAQVSSVLLELGNALTTSSLLSNKQREAFLEGLVASRLLTYQSNYRKFVEKAFRKAEKEGISGKEVEKKVKESLDGVSWEVERNRRLQAQTVAVTAQLAGQLQSEVQQVITVAGLLNTAHLATGPDTSRYYGDDDYFGSISQLEELEEKIYSQKEVYATELVQLGLADAVELEGIDEWSLEEFRTLKDYGDMYDKFIAIHFVRDFKAQSAAERFKELQRVIRAGFAMGIRDGNLSTRRLYGED